MIKKISDQDQKDWKKFVNSSEKLENKDKTIIKIQKNSNYKSIDLHGYTLENANKVISDFIDKCYSDDVKKIKVITGKGSRSKNKQDPYLSIDLSILKYSVPDYINSNQELLKIIKSINQSEIESISKGSFIILLKKKK